MRFQVLAPVIRGRKGEYVDLFADLQTKGYSRARVDGVVHSLADPPTLKKQEKHTIEVVVDRLAVKESAKRRLTDSVETALQLGGGLVVLEFVDLPEDDPHRERTFSEHLACLVRRPVVRGDGAAQLLVQLAVRRLPGLPRPRHPQGGRPRAGRHRPGQELRGGRDRALEQRAQPGVLRPAGPGARRRARLHAQDALREADEGAAEGRAARARDRGARPLPQPVRPGAQLLHRVRGRHPVPGAAARRGRERGQPGALRGLHARGALPDLRGRPAQARGARGDAGRPVASPTSRPCRSPTAPSSCAASSSTRARR